MLSFWAKGDDVTSGTKFLNPLRVVMFWLWDGAGAGALPTVDYMGR